MRRRLLYGCLLAVLALTPSLAAAKPAPSWAQAELKAVVAAGLMAKEAAARPNDALTRAELETLVAGLVHTDPVAAAKPAATVTMAGLDARLVNMLGLTEAARTFTQSAKTAGLSPPSGTRSSPGSWACARTTLRASTTSSSRPLNLRRGRRLRTPRLESCASAAGTPRARRGSRRLSSSRR